MKACVAVISKDERELAATLDTIHSHNPEILVIVIDASEKRLDDIRQQRPWVQWIDYTPPAGAPFTIPHQRNAAVAAAIAAGCDIVAFADSGGIPAENWLDRLTAPIGAGETNVTCGPIHPARPGVYRTINNEPHGSDVENPPTANMAFHVRCWQQIGGFDESYQYGSDVDFAWRLADAGWRATQCADAVMHMDWGDSRRSWKRSWRYGRARARWWHNHPRRRVRYIARHPDSALYPALLAATAAAAAAPKPVRRSVTAATTAIVAALALRAKRRGDNAGAVTADHLIGAAGTIYQFASGRIGEQRIVMWPNDPVPYQQPLIGELTSRGVTAGLLNGPTRSQTANIALLPAQLAARRLAGARIAHIHWLYLYNLPWANSSIARRALRLLLTVTLKTARATGLRIIWTCHNTLPHEKIFDDDIAARKTLLAHCDAVICHNQPSADSVRQLGWDGPTHIIPQGLAQPDRTVSYTDGDRKLLHAGVLRAYKGTGLLLDALEQLGAQAPATRITGHAGLTYGHQLAAAAAQLPTVSLQLGRIGDAEWEAMWQDNTICVQPFQTITNSASAGEALSRGCVTILPDLPALADIPDSGCVRFHAGDAASLAAAIKAVCAMDASELTQIGANARAWAAERTWRRCAEQTEHVYRSVL